MRDIFLTASQYLSPIPYKITFTVWGKLAPVAGERGKNIVTGLRVNTPNVSRRDFKMFIGSAETTSLGSLFPISITH